VVTDTAVITPHNSLVAALQHQSNHTRPDVAFAVSCLARFLKGPTAPQYARVKDVVCILKGTPLHRLHFGGDSHECPLYAHCASDYAIVETRRSVTALAVKCGKASVSWKSAKQATVSRSTAEAYYVVTGEVAKEIQYLHPLADKLHLAPDCIPIGIDNAKALFLAQEAVSAPRTKHIDVSSCPRGSQVQSDGA
jgi:hypothetical protein